MEQDEDKGLNQFEQWKEDARKEYRGMSAIEAVRKMAEVEEIQVKREDVVKKLNAYYDVLRLEVVPGAMEAEGIESPFTVQGIGRVVLSGDMYVSVKKGMKEGLYKWLRRMKLSDLIVPTVNSSTLKACVKGRMEKGKPIPDEYLNVTPITRASITRKV